MTSLCKLLTVLTNLNVPIAHEKTYPASTELEFLGVLLNSQRVIASLPSGKLGRTKQDLFKLVSKKIMYFARTSVFDRYIAICMPRRNRRCARPRIFTT
jgi:hypothetical protein